MSYLDLWQIYSTGLAKNISIGVFLSVNSDSVDLYQDESRCKNDIEMIHQHRAQPEMSDYLLQTSNRN